jgi:hypothetical protein
LEPSALTKPSEANGTVLTCYEEGLQDADPRIRAIHIDHIVRTISSEKTVLCQAHTESHFSNVVGVLRKYRKFKGVCGVCEHLGLLLQSDINCRNMHDFTC